jgi:hypothetical protein
MDHPRPELLIEEVDTIHATTATQKKAGPDGTAEKQSCTGPSTAATTPAGNAAWLAHLDRTPPAGGCKTSTSSPILPLIPRAADGTCHLQTQPPCGLRSWNVKALRSTAIAQGNQATGGRAAGT